MNIDEAMRYIKKVSSLGTLPGLERITFILEKLGNPEKKIKNIIHVAGTNGKGSFSAMLSSVLMKQGYSVGMFTSPHMLKYNERISIDGKNISDADISRLLEKVVAAVKEMNDTPSEFEITTALGYLYFAEKQPDFTVVECGMGGKWDATNVIDSPILSVITGVALDHTAFLGDTISKIASEKAGIIKRGRPVLFGGIDEDAFEVISKTAESLGSKVYRTDRSLISVNKYGELSTSFDYDGRHYCIGLAGHYQPYNAANVINAVSILKKHGIRITMRSLKEGLRDAKWIGRFERLCASPVVYFDGGHNPEGIAEAVSSVREIFKSIKINVISGVLSDKDYNEIAKIVSEIAAKVFTVTPDSTRALGADEYASVYKSIGVESAAYASFESATFDAFNDSKEKGIPLLCVGSLYSYPDFISALNKVMNENG